MKTKQTSQAYSRTKQRTIETKKKKKQKHNTTKQNNNNKRK